METALNMYLTRISHKVSTAEAQSTMSTALRSLRLLDVLFKYACGVFGRAPCIHGTLHLLATKPREKCGLAWLPDYADFTFHPLEFLLCPPLLL